jgi:hypothetical protein
VRIPRARLQPQALLTPLGLLGTRDRRLGGRQAGERAGAPADQGARTFRDRLAEVVSSDAIPAWLDTPNEAFDGLKPLEVIGRGEIDRLWNMIFYLESGVAS